MIISEKQIMQLIIKLHRLTNMLFDTSNLHESGVMKECMDLLDEITNQQSEKLKVVEECKGKNCNEV